MRLSTLNHCFSYSLCFLRHFCGVEFDNYRHFQPALYSFCIVRVINLTSSYFNRSNALFKKFSRHRFCWNFRLYSRSVSNNMDPELKYRLMDEVISALYEIIVIIFAINLIYISDGYRMFNRVGCWIDAKSISCEFSGLRKIK